MKKVLDSWALMAWMLGEGAAGEVQRLLDHAETGRIELLMSVVNVGEIFYLVSRRRGEPEAEEFLKALPGMPIRTVLPTEGTILGAARLKARFPISYADAFAAETAREQDAALVTGDPELKVLGRRSVLKLEWIGRRASH